MVFDNYLTTKFSKFCSFSNTQVNPSLLKYKLGYFKTIFSSFWTIACVWSTKWYNSYNWLFVRTTLYTIYDSAQFCSSKCIPYSNEKYEPSWVTFCRKTTGQRHTVEICKVTFVGEAFCLQHCFCFCFNISQTKYINQNITSQKDSQIKCPDILFNLLKCPYTKRPFQNII